MSGSEDEGHSSAIRTPAQLIAVVIAAFAFPVVIILLVAQLVTGDRPIDQNSPVYSDEAVAKRLKPVGELVVASDSLLAGAQLAEGAGEPAASAPLTDTDSGEDRIKAIYTASCAACHTTGAAGAPKLGDKLEWASRINAGSDVLYESALKGKNAMPPKGGNASLSDSDVKAAVDYMVSQSK
ncbi:MAG: cytochrome c5 family protein [Nitrosospira sp.]|nr:cytochrome c5 family protein [Nitrosospira sp.]